jgi:hypothetical protein
MSLRLTQCLADLLESRKETLLRPSGRHSSPSQEHHTRCH